MARAHRALLSLLVLIASVSGAASKLFTVVNNCEYTVWPGILSSAGSAGMESTGFALAPGESRAMSVPSGWSGRLWGRTLCSTDDSGKFACVTGDCGSGKQDCAGGGAAPPATLAEFTMDGSNGMDFYDVSLVDGYNLPVLVVPQGAAPGGNCAPAGCMVDLNGACPADLRVASASSHGGGVACKSACEAFGSAQYCCSGEYGNPNTCKPSAYSQFFKNACPRAYSYAYDDATSTFTCAGSDTTYVITFCPSTTSVKSAGSSPHAPGLPLINDTMVYLGGDQLGAGAAAAGSPSPLLHAVVAVVSLVLARAF
ncbi:pathogenesis-related thaumatin-like protein 3.5 [Phragmites australis]|uniref:pathogenesis-related thaumatin-like protein 3.5 n=1 Tax=Phragmites australis TaxID=29695 RepID=UPI002D7948E8|nr:pathogenesis-related thaumatin-like protein 3.5 [Phragmites australis]